MPPPPQRALTDQEMNVLAAKVLRAEMTGSEVIRDEG